MKTKLILMMLLFAVSFSSCGVHTEKDRRSDNRNHQNVPNEQNQNHNQDNNQDHDSNHDRGGK